MQPLSIGKLAKSAHVAIDTIRYYEKSGLLPKADRRASGYRQYGPEDLRRLTFIRRAKDLGFSLEEIATLLSLRSDRASCMDEVREVARTKLAVVEQKLAELKRMRRVLQDLVKSCPGQGSTELCPILKAFDDTAGDQA